VYYASPSGKRLADIGDMGKCHKCAILLNPN
jgi:hypothetical protein